MYSERDQRRIAEYKSIVDAHHRSICPLKPTAASPFFAIFAFYVGGAALSLLVVLALIAMRL